MISEFFYAFMARFVFNCIELCGSVGVLKLILIWNLIVEFEIFNVQLSKDWMKYGLQ